MGMDEETTQTFSALNEVKLSAHDKDEILHALRREMNQQKPGRRFNRGKLSGFAAAVAAVAIVAGGFGIEMRHHQSGIPSPAKGVTTAANQTNANNANSINHANTNSDVNTTTSQNNVSSTKNSTSPSNTASNQSTDNSTGVQKKNSSSVNYASEIAIIQRKGYDVTGTTPNASVQTDSGETLTAWIGVAKQSDGHNQYVFFFLNDRYLGTDTSKASAEITRAVPAGTGSIAVTYPVYKSTDSYANPTGTPVTITYQWNGSKLVPNKPYPKQFG